MRRIVCVAFLCVLAAPLAMADLSVQYAGLENSSSVSVNPSVGGWSSTSVGITQLNIKGSDAVSLGIKGNGIDALCIDIADSASTSFQSYTAKSLAQAPDAWAGAMGATRAKYLAALLDTYWIDLSGSGANSLTGISGTYSDTQVASALQLAVWEIIDEYNTTDVITPSGWTVDRGEFRATSDSSKILDLADLMLGYVAAVNVESYNPSNYLALSNSTGGGTGYQDYVVRVPLPGAVLLGFLGFGAAGLKLRRFV